MNTPERFKRVEEVFLAASRLRGPEREAYLDERCAGDDSLRSEVAALLREDDATRGVLDRAIVGAPDLDALERGVAEAPMPERVGRYRLLRCLGRGGMGTVYEAEQDEPRRRVALKVLRPGAISEGTLRRFRYEIEALGRLTDPGIARIFDAGMSDHAGVSQPYFTMELVEGLPLLEYATNRSLTTRDRLALLARICDAVHHAHQHGVIHRDLKPANILVEESGQPKILDFGVARAIESPADTPTYRTESGLLVGTLPYMSPEQAGGETDAIDTRSDVYSLGVVAYELLTGRLPYEVRSRAINEAVRVIREVDPTSLSTNDRSLRGDVETIVGKALEKDRSRRYQSASEFGVDLRRYLANEPILARRPSATYQLSKFAKRNKPLVAGVGAAFAVLVASLAVITGLLLRTLNAERIAVRDRNEAALQASIAEEINAFLVDDLIAAVSPERTQDRSVTLLDLLRAAGDRMEQRDFEHPAVEAELRHTIARTYFDVGEHAVALPFAERAVELGVVAFGEADERTLRMRNTLGHLHRAAGRYAEAAPQYERVLELRRRNPSAEPGLIVVAMTNIASLRREQGLLSESLVLHEEAYALAMRELSPGDGNLLTAMSTLAGVYREVGRLDDAASLYESEIRQTEQIYGPDHPRLFRAMNALAIVYGLLHRDDEADAMYLRVLEGQRRVLGPDHPHTLVSQSNLASLRNNQRRFAEARDLLVDCLERSRRILGEDHPGTILASFNLAKSHRGLDEKREARALFEETHSAAARVYGPSHMRTLVIMNELIRCRVAMGDGEGLIAQSGEQIELARGSLPENHPFLGMFLETHGGALELAGMTGEAIEAYRECAAILDGPNAGPYAPSREVALRSIDRLESARPTTGANGVGSASGSPAP
ncbi:MAG: serine/threonine protein kinase [Phycisphaeraceae bacterium]|nr:serine/threonine protein kinase [Phycisphaeraceae bacterium]